MRNRQYFDINFKNRFKIGFFKPLLDDCIATVDSIIPCENGEQFAMKVQALAGMIDRIEENSIRDLIKTPEKRQVTGSLNILEQI